MRLLEGVEGGTRKREGRGDRKLPKMSSRNDLIAYLHLSSIDTN